MTAPGLAVARAADISPREAEEDWLVESVWGKSAVGIVGGQPKCMKSWFGLELAVSVATGTPCLERFPVKEAGPALVFLAEDALPNVRERIEGLCHRRRRRIDDLDLFVITEPVLRLDDVACREKLERTVERYAPKLLLLDPLIRLHRLSENDSQETSGLLGHLRELQRRHGVSVVLVHHASKRHRAQPGQSLRGSSDLHAWTDTTAILVRKEDRVALTLEHRFAPAPAPLVLGLVTGDGCIGLAIVEDARVPRDDAADLPDAVIATLRSAGEPLRRGELRDRLRVNNRRLGEALTILERSGRLRRGPGGWTATNGNTGGPRALRSRTAGKSLRSSPWLTTLGRGTSRRRSRVGIEEGRLIGGPQGESWRGRRCRRGQGRFRGVVLWTTPCSHSERRTQSPAQQDGGQVPSDDPDVHGASGPGPSGPRPEPGVSRSFPARPKMPSRTGTLPRCRPVDDPMFPLRAEDPEPCAAGRRASPK